MVSTAKSANACPSRTCPWSVCLSVGQLFEPDAPLHHVVGHLEQRAGRAERVRAQPGEGVVESDAQLRGFVAVLVGLVSGGPVTALLVLGLNVLVQTLEGEVLQPFLMGRVVRLHPLLVVVSIAVGVVLAGIVGALLAVPVVLVVRAVLNQLPGTSNTQTG